MRLDHEICDVDKISSPTLNAVVISDGGPLVVLQVLSHIELGVGKIDRDQMWTCQFFARDRISCVFSVVLATQNITGAERRVL